MQTLNLKAPGAEGKTKQVFGNLCVIRNKDAITALDGKKRDVIEGKAEWATATTCNVFEYLIQNGMGEDLAFVSRLDEVSFLAQECRMYPLEVVVRREAHGSYLKRNPRIPKGERFESLVTEFYFKTSGGKWDGKEGHEYDDPLIQVTDHGMRLFDPRVPLTTEAVGFVPWHHVPRSMQTNMLDEYRTTANGHMTRLAVRAFLLLEQGWRSVGGKLVDFKVEFGKTRHDKTVLADDITNDSWRVLMNGNYVDKQLYRDGKPLDVVAASFARVVELTGQFK